MIYGENKIRFKFKNVFHHSFHKLLASHFIIFNGYQPKTYAEPFHGGHNFSHQKIPGCDQKNADFLMAEFFVTHTVINGAFVGNRKRLDQGLIKIRESFD